MKSKNKLFTMFFALFTFIFLGTMNVSAAGEHQFSIQAYDWNAFDNDWEGSGSGEEILDGAIVKPGQVIQIALYYVPGADTENNMQVGLMYDKDLVEPMYDSGNVYVETDWSTTYNGGMWPAKGTSPANKKLTNWTLMSNDYVAGSYITMIVKDTTMSTTLETEGTFANIYFKVKDDAPSGSELKFYYNDDYTTIRNSRPFVSSGIDFTIQGDVSSNTALHTLTATGNGVTYTSSDFVPDSNTVKKYSIIVPNSVTSIDLQATATDAKTIVSGTGVKTLNVGDNTFTISALAESSALENYEVKIYRLNNEATLSNLTLTNSVDIGTFNKDTLSYSATVPYKTTNTTISATATDSNATVTGAGVFNFTNYGTTPNVKEIVVKAENCNNKYANVEGNTCTSKTYTVTVNRTAPSSNKNLSELKVNNVLVSGFDKATLEYTLEDIKDNTTTLNVTAIAEDANAKVTGTGSKTLNVGPNVIEVKVTAEDGTSQTYKINVKKLSSDNTLKSLSVNKGTLSPAFSASTKTYTVTMDKDVTTINENMITAVATDSNATIVYDTEKTINSDTTTAFTITVTAENGSSETYTLNVKKAKNDDATLKDLTVSVGTLNPGFSSSTTSYTVNVGNEVTSITVTGEATDSNANVEITGGESLNVGSNTVKVTVTSESGNKKIYTVNVVRAASNDADLKDIKIDGNLIDGFNKDTLEYTLDDITTDISKLNVTASSNHDKAKVTITGADAIKVGNNTITIKVTAEDGVTTKTYKINVKKLSSDNTLKSLSVNKGTLNPSFSSNTKTYTVTMEEDVTVFNKEMINAVATDSNATIVYDTEKTINSDTTTAFTITVTAENGSIETYTLNVKKEKNSNATLKSLTVSDGTLSPGFSSGTTSYTVNVGNEVTSIVVTGEATDLTANVEVSGGAALVVGNNTITVTVTSESGDKKVYTVNVVRAGSNDADLSELKVNGVSVDGFDKDTTEYNLTKVPYSTTKVNVTATTSHNKAKIEGLGEINLNTGSNTIEVKVTAEDGITTKTYKLNIEREKNNDATLKSLTIGKYALTPTFDKDELEYTITVSNTTEMLKQSDVRVEATDVKATITLDADLALSSENDNYYNIKVVAEDGITTNTYKIKVIRPKSSDATLKELSINGGTITPAFASNIKEYDVTMSSDVTKFNKNMITAVANHNKAEITYSAEIEVNKENAKEFVITVTAENGTEEKYTLNVKVSEDDSLKEITSTKHTIVEDSIKTVKLYETALELKNNLDNENEYLEIWKADESEKVEDDAPLATGMIVKLIQDGKEIDRKVVVIKGDTSGDGEIDLFDAVKILNHYLEKTPLTNAYEDAAYVNDDESVDLFDAVMILNHYLGKTSLH